MKVRLVQCAVFAIVCGLTTLMYSAVTRNKRKRRKMKKIKENELYQSQQVISKVPFKLQDTAEYILLMREHNYLTTPKLTPSLRWVKVGKVTNLNAYPLVSGKPCAVDECEVKFEGMNMFKNGQLINWDRAFVVYNAETKCIITSNSYPRLHEVDLSIVYKYIILQAAEMPTLNTDLKDNEIIECTYQCSEKILFPKIVCTDCGNDAAQWLSKFLLGKASGLRLGHAINAVGCMGVYWQLVLRNCILHQKARREDCLRPFVDILHSVLISPLSYDKTSDVLRIFEPTKVISPNIVILISKFYGENWEWIKIGNVIIRNTQPLINLSENPAIADVKLFGLGVNCELHFLGRVKLNDNVYIHVPDDNAIMENSVPRKKSRFN